MKRKELIKQLESVGWVLNRHGASHDIYSKKGLKPISVPRHTEINQYTAEGILKQAGLK